MASARFVLAAGLAMTGLIILLREPKPPRDHFDIRPRGPDAFGRLFLERVQHVDNLAVPHRIDRAAPSWSSTTSKIPGPRPFHGFAFGCLPPNCARPSALPNSSFTDSGKER